MVRPFRAPHHSATAAALVGGGSPPRPGEISLAYAGVLFLDEMPELPRAALEALREPLETGRITISRAARTATFPARFQLVAAMNPCPCGYLGAFAATGRHCRCTADAVARYQGKLSGPLLDRIDMQVEVPAVRPGELMGAPDGDASAVIAARVIAARRRQHDRQGVTNSELAVAELDQHCALDDTSRDLLQRAAVRLGWSGRGLHRVQKLARTIADLHGSQAIRSMHIAEAMQWRRALPQA
jgi:magnesium chelatase family protein